MRQILKGSTAYLDFSTRNASRVLTNADSLPTITGAQFDGVAIATTGMSVEQMQDSTPANITGRYQVKILNTTTTGWTAQKSGVVLIRATIGGVTCDEELRFSVVQTSSESPFIDVD